jgi:hypothetical protein
MFSFKRFLKNLFYPFFPNPISDAEWKQRRELRIRRLVAHYARGNVSLQQGIYLTNEDIKKLQERNYNHDFGKD